MNFEAGKKYTVERVISGYNPIPDGCNKFVTIIRNDNPWVIASYETAKGDIIVKFDIFGICRSMSGEIFMKITGEYMP